MKRTRALLKEAKGGAMQAMSAVVPQLELLGRYTRLSPVDNPTFDIPGLGSLSFPSLTEQTATDGVDAVVQGFGFRDRVALRVSAIALVLRTEGQDQ